MVSYENGFDCRRTPVRETTEWSARVMGMRILLAAVPAALIVAAVPASGQQRALGSDISYWNCGSSSTGISQDNWNAAYAAGRREFVFIRATRGGTTGVDQRQGTPGGGTVATLAHRYDDPRFIQNIQRATSAGMVAGPYHFARPDVAGNTGADEADHFIQMAGAWMRPGYLIPVFDQEAGSGSDALAQFAIDFSDRLYAAMRIRPCMYINGNYSSILQGAAAARRNALAQPAACAPSAIGPAFPVLWNARYSDNTNPGAIPVQTGTPKTTYSVLSLYYGPWDDYGNAQPWSFWQYASTVSIPGFNAVDATVDGDVSHGDIEYVRNYLAPAVWWHDSSGNWSTLANWNSGQAPIAPVTPPDQARPYATGPLPIARLPGASGTGPTSGQYDTVILERPGANITVTLSSGSHSIRKLYMRETLHITGGTLTINYNPDYRADVSADVVHAGRISAQFSGPALLGGSGRLNAHTLQVDPGSVFTLAGGTLVLNTMLLMPHASAPAKILMSGDAAFHPLADAAARIRKGSGTGISGAIDLGGGARTLDVGDGASDVDLCLDVPVANGALAKAGPGTMCLASASSYAGGTTVAAGRLLVNNSAGSGTGGGRVTVIGGVLGGAGTIAGPVAVQSGGAIAPGVSIGVLTLNDGLALEGSTVMEIDRNGGAPLSDRIVLTAGALGYGGSLVVSNAGAALVGGEAFALFAAPSYGGAFASSNLPPLGAGLNWHTGALASNGVVRVNRAPAVSPLTFTNTAPAVLRIPFQALIDNGSDPDADALTVADIDRATTKGIPLSIDAGSVSYAYHRSVTDQFHYTLNDGCGGSATGRVTIVNIGSIPAAEFVGAPTWSGGSVRLHFTATPGWTYYLERSVDLGLWVTISTNRAPESGALEVVDDFRDLEAPPPAAFYRLSWPP